MHNLFHFISRPIILFILLVGLSHAMTLQARSVAFVRDYTYNASENDSKVSARKAALEQLQRAVIEEVGVQVQSSFTNTESFNDGELKQEVLSNFETFSQALTKTKILEEKWNGETFYIKASIEVDPDGVTNAVNALTSGNADLCTANKETVKALLQKPANTDRNQALVDIASTTHFDEDCNQWQYGILSSLTYHTNYPVVGYRAFIFAQLDSIKSYDLPQLMPKVLSYAFSHSGDVTSKEWETTLKAIHRMPAKHVLSVLRVLSNLETESYQKKVSDILLLSSNGQLGDPTISKKDAIQAIIKISLRKHTLFVAQFYLNHADELSDKNKLAPIVSKIYAEGYSTSNNSNNPELTGLANKVMNHFLTNNDIKQLDRRAKQSLYDLMRPLINENRHQGRDAQMQDNQHIRELLKRYPNQFAYLIESQRISARTKNLFLLRHNLPAANLCQPIECAKQVLNRDLTTAEQNTYLEYLVAYGESAGGVEKSMIKLLDRAQVMSGSVYRTQRKKALVTILMNIKSTEAKAINLLINSLEDFDYKVPDAAIQALIAIDQPAFTLMVVAFPQSKGLSQRRMVKAMGKMKPSADIVQFLKSIPTSNSEHMRFAVEDAIDAQTK